MEEREGEDGDYCCTLDVLESICQGVSVLAMGSSSRFHFCDKTQLSGWTGNALASTSSMRLASGRNRLGRVEARPPVLFL